MDLKENKTFSVVVTYNGSKWIKNCIRSLQQSSIQNKIIVVDNDSKDSTKTIIQNEFENIILISLKENIGFGKANNVGIKYAIEEGADYVLLLNQDAFIEKNTLKRLISYHKINPSYGILSPLHKNKDSQVDSLFFQNIGSVISKEDVCESKFINAAIWLMSKECIEKNGGFMPIFTHYGEDDNYCQRVIYSGLKIGYCSKISAIHDRGQRKKSLSLKYHFNRTYVAILAILANPFLKSSYEHINALFNFYKQNLKRIHIVLLSPFALIKIFFNMDKLFLQKEMSKTRAKNFL